jgi:Phage-integrase repeat unit
VHTLHLRSDAEWKAYLKSGKKPDDIPSTPNKVYIDDGWAGIGDWLGTSRVAAQLRQYRSFEKARAFARALGLKLGIEWKAYCKSGKKPDDIPAAPHNTYADAGWTGIRDWLGYVR